MSRKEETVNGYPNPNIPNHEKEEADYILQYGRKMYSDFQNNQYFGYADRAIKLKNKSYRLSEEDTSIYISKSNPSGDIAYSNLDYSPVSLVPAFVDTIVNSILDKGFEITVHARDRMTSDRREQEKNKLTGQMLGKAFSEKLSSMFGVDVREKNAPTSKEEVDLKMETEYTDEMEIALEQGIREVRLMNHSKEIDRYICDDLVTCGEGVVKVNLNKNGEIKYRYIDDVNFFRSYSKDPDNRRLKHAGHVTTMTIAELRDRVREEDGWDEKRWEEIAGTVNDAKHGTSDGTAINLNERRGDKNWWDSVDVDVVEFEFIDFNYENYEIKETEYGSYVYEKDDNYMQSDEVAENRELIRDSYQVVYKGSWIRGTDYLFDYGRVHNISINPNDFYTANLSYIVYSMYGRSVVEKIIPYIEQVQLIHIRMQKLSSRVRPDGIAIDVSVLENAVMNGNGGYFSPLELSEMYDETGNLLFRSRNEDPDMPQGRPPVTKLDTSIRDQLSTLIDMYNHQVQQIRLVSGVNDFRDGTNTHPKTLVGVQEQSMRASNNATYAIDTALYDITTRTAERTVEYFQDVVSNKESRDRYERILGTEAIEVFERIQDVPIDLISLDIQFEPTIEEKASLQKHVEIALGKELIAIEDSIMIMRVDNINIGERMLIQRKLKLKEEREEMMAKQAEEEGKAREAEQQAKQKQAQLEAQLEIQKKIGIASEEAKIEVWREQQLMAFKERLLKAEIAGKVQVAEVVANGGMDKARYMEDQKSERDREGKSMESRLIEQRAGRVPEQDFKTPEDEAMAENKKVEPVPMPPSMMNNPLIPNDVPPVQDGVQPPPQMGIGQQQPDQLQQQPSETQQPPNGVMGQG